MAKPCVCESRRALHVRCCGAHLSAFGLPKGTDEEEEVTIGEAAEHVARLLRDLRKKHL